MANRKSLLQQIVETDGRQGLNEKYVDYALSEENGGGFGADYGGIRYEKEKNKDGSRTGYLTHDYSNVSQTLQDKQKAYADRVRATTAQNSWASRNETVKTNPERDSLLEEYKRLANTTTNSIPVVQRRNEIRKRLDELDVELGNGIRDYTVSDKTQSVIGGAVKDYGGGLLNYIGGRLSAMGETSAPVNPSLLRAQGMSNAEISQAMEQAAAANPNRGERLRSAGASVEEIAASISDDAQQDLTRAKNGLSKLGQAGVDIATNMIQMGFDVAVGALTGGNALIPMYARSAGSSYAKAKGEGASTTTATLYSMASGGIEVFTEKMADGLAGIYGAGAADVFTERMIRKLTKSDLGRSFLRLVIGAGEEGIEEVVSDLLQPYAETIYNGNSPLSVFQNTFKGTYDPSDLLYDFIIGAAVGMIGGGIGAATGSNARPNQIARYADQAESTLREQGVSGRQATRVGEIIANQAMGEDLTRREQRLFDRTEGAQEIAQGIQNQEKSYVRSILETEKQQRAAQAKENAQQQRVAKYMERVRAGEVDETRTADTKNATVEYQGRQAKVDFVRDGNENRIRLTFDDGSEKTVSYQEAEEAGLDDSIKNLIVALSAIGPNAPAAYSVYESSQEVGKYAAAMDEAINLYAAQGQDVRQAAKAAKEAGSTALITYLNDAQLEMAQSLGAKIYEQKQTQVKEAGTKLKQIRQQAQEAMNSQDKTAAEGLAAVNTTLAEAREHYKTIRAAYDQTVEYLEEMAANGQQETEAYQNALEQANYLRSDLEGTQNVISTLEAERKNLQAKQPIKRKKGTVSFAGATDGKTTFEGVDPSKLNKKQNAVVAMVMRLADVLDIDFVFFQGPAGTGGFYRGGNTIYININSGMGVGDFNNVIAAGSLSHELTHWLQEYAPEEYEALRQFIVNDIIEKRGADAFERLVQQQMNWEKGRQLSRDAAIDEVVANACQTMLRDSSAITELAQQNKSLAEKIRDFIKDLIDRIKAAFEDVNISNKAAIYDAARAIQGEYEDILKLWDDALRAAAETGSAVRAMETETQEEMPAAAQRIQNQEWEEEAAPGKAMLYQQWDTQHNEWAPEFYSKMDQTITDWTNGKGQKLPEKMAASQVVGWLKGKGVKDEEIKWSGIVPYLQGKKTVTQAELQAVMAGNEIQIQTKTLEDRKLPEFVAEIPSIGDYLEFANYNEAYDYARRLATRKGLDPDQIRFEDGKFFVFDPEAFDVQVVLEVQQPDVWDEETGEKIGNRTHWKHYTLPGGQNYREILFQIPGMKYENRASRLHWRDDAPGTIAHARIQDMTDEHGVPVLFVEEIQSDLHNAGASSGFTSEDQIDQYNKLMREARDKNRKKPTLVNSIYYALGELALNNPDVFGDSYVNQASIELWIDGSSPSPSDSFDEKYNTPEMQKKQSDLAYSILTDEQKKQVEEIRKASKTLKEFTAENEGIDFFDAAPDVPYAGSADTYHEYVMKHILRMAAEGGYGAVGWTTAQQQVDRWSDEYAEGYRIEYDQNIPKFMRKYGKQWGATVQGINLENGEEVWGMYVDQDMADSVLQQGQPRFQQWGELTDEEKQAEINASMTMDQARTMIQKAFVANDIKEWYDGEFKNGDEWIKAKGIDEVAMYIENEYEIARKYLYSNEHIKNDDYSIYDILDAYLAGTLTGKTKAKQPRVDVSRGYGYQDSRFYAPYSGSVTPETWALANSRATKSNQSAVNQARKNILMAAHNGDITGTLGITAAELNKKLRQWSRYSAKAREASMRINANVAPENQWTGIQNCSILNGMNISDDDILSMVAGITGKSSEYGRRYVGNAMLALDTHIDWSWLSFDFKNGYVNPERKSVRGLYEDSKKLITVGAQGSQNTVSHEMGHALDYQWERDLFGENRGRGTALSQNAWVESLIRDDDGRTFYRNYRAFIDELQDVNENYNSYTMEPTEIFARFVAKFVQWTQNIAGAHTYDEYLGYNDRFTTKHYLDFAKLLQEKAALDSKWAMEDAAAAQTRNQTWNPDQISLDEWMNGSTQETTNMHPRIRKLLDDAAAMEQRVREFFSQIPEDSEYYLDPDEIDDMMEVDPFGSAYDGYMYGAEQLIMNLSDLSKGMQGAAKEQAYELMDELLGYLSTSQAANWKEDRLTENKTFTEWYNRKHPSMYYPGYVPGKFLKYEEKRYLQNGIRNGIFAGEELAEAQRKLAAIDDPASGTWYQKWDDFDPDDFATETEERKESYTRIQAEDVTLAEAIAGLNAAIAKQKTTIGKIQERLKLGRTQETRESDAMKLAKHLLAKHGSTADPNRVAAELKALGDYLLQTKKVDQDELKQRARVVAADIIENAEQEAEPTGEEQIYREIADNIKGKKLTIDSKDLGELDEVGGYDAFRRVNFGRFTLAKRTKNGEAKEGYETVESAYRALQATYGTAYFPDMQGKTEGDLIQTMASFFDLAEPEIVNPYESFKGEAIEETANSIVADALDGILRPVSTEATTKQQAKELGKQIEAGEQGAVNLIAAAQKIAEAYETADSRVEALKLSIELLKKQEGKENEKELEALRETVYDLTIALDKAESHYRTLQKSAEARMAQIRAEGRARQTEIRAEAKAKANAAAAKHYKEMAKRARERRKENAGAAKYRAKIQQQAKKLSDWLMKNSDKEHIPEAIKAPLISFLSSLDFTSKRALNGGAQTQNDMKFGARLQKLQQMLANQQSYLNGDGTVQEDLGGYIDIGQDMLQFLRDMAQKATDEMSTGNYYTINRMSATELKDLSNLLASLTTSIRNMNNLMANARYETVRQAASQDIEEMERLGQAADRESKGIWKFLKWKDATPYYAMKRLGRGAQSIFDGLTRGWEKLAFHAQEIIDFTEKTYTDKEVNEWKKDIHSIELSDGSRIRMTTAQIMELAMLYNRDQAQKHLRAGGMRIGNIEYKKGTITDTKHYHLTAEDINKLFDMLTSRQLEVAYKLQKFMANKGAEWGNEISMRRFGYNFYTEGENYYPIRTDSNDRAMRDTDAQENSMFRLLNLSSSKSLNPKASNALVVGDIFDTFADHMADQAKLNALGLPILDGIKWFNFKERIDLEDGTYDTRTLQAAMEQAFGSEAQHYFRTLMKDINGVTESGDRGTNLASRMMSNYKIASVGANLRVAMLQPTAYVRAQIVISPRNLLRAFAYKNGYKEAMKYSGTAVWKSMGYYDTNISRNMRQQIQHNETVRDKIVEMSMKLAEHGDQVTWGRIWVACKLQAQEMNPELTGEALIQETANLFRQVIYSSQVMDSTLTRSELMRSHSFWDKNLTAFMAEPTLSYNILLDAYSEYEKDVRERGKQGAWQRNSDKILKAITVYESSAIVAAIAESIADAIRDDDDDESALDKFLQAFLGEDSFLDGNLFQDVLLTGKIPYAKNIWSVLQGYDNSDMVFGGIYNLVKVFEIWKETVQLATGDLDKATKTTYYGNMTAWGKVYKTLQSLSQVSGFPVSGMMRDVFAIWNATAGSIVPYWKIKTYDKNHLSQGQKNAWTENLKGLGITQGQYQRMRTEMDADGNGSLKQDEVGAYLDEQVKFGNLTKEQAEAIWASAGTTWKKTYSQWRGDPEPAAATPKTAAAATPAITQEKITTYDQFKKAAHIFSDNKEEAYNLWKSEVEPKGIDLDTYVRYINDSDVNDNGSVTQNELGPTLENAISRRELTEPQAEAIWHTIWNQPRSKTFAKWSSAHTSKGMPGIEELNDLNDNPDRYDVGDTTVSYEDIDQEYISKGYDPVRTGDVRVLEEWQPGSDEIWNTVDQMVDAFPGYEDSLMFDYVQEMYAGYLDNPDYEGQTFDDYLDGEVPQMIAYGRRYKTGKTTKATRREALYDEIRLAAGGMRYAKSILNRGR